MPEVHPCLRSHHPLCTLHWGRVDTLPVLQAAGGVTALACTPVSPPKAAPCSHTHVLPGSAQTSRSEACSEHLLVGVQPLWPSHTHGHLAYGYGLGELMSACLPHQVPVAWLCLLTV